MTPGELAGLRAVVFDVGETLVDESRAWWRQAEEAGVTPFSLMGVVGGLIERGRDHREAWAILGVPAPGSVPAVTAADLYPDAIGCLRTARRHGLVVGIAGNQPAGGRSAARGARVPADFIASSAGWGVEKPSSAFFRQVALEAAAAPVAQSPYVGDRLDNDVLPARAEGMRSASSAAAPGATCTPGARRAISPTCGSNRSTT